MGYRGKAISIFLTAALTSMVFIGLINFNVKAGPVTTVYVETDDVIEVDVSPDAHGSYTIEGIVHCRSGSPNTVTVHLWAETTVGIANIDKEEVIFRGGRQSI